MNGVHDMGGMQDMGPIRHEANEPTFHERWEGRVYALSRVLRTRGGLWSLDANRHSIEVLPPAEYLRMSYYERWLASILTTAIAAGDVTQAELETGTPAPGSARKAVLLAPEAVPAMVDRRLGAARRRGRSTIQVGTACARPKRASNRAHAIAALRAGQERSHRARSRR